MALGSIFLLPNATFFVELILFVIVFGVVAKFILPPLTAAMDERARKVRASQEASEEGQIEADRLVAERRRVLDEARSEARANLDQATSEANRLYEEGRAAGQAEHDRIVAEAAPGIEAERRAVEEQLLGRIGELVTSAAARVIGGDVDEAKHRVLIADAVASYSARAGEATAS